MMRQAPFNSQTAGKGRDSPAVPGRTAALRRMEAGHGLCLPIRTSAAAQFNYSTLRWALRGTPGPPRRRATHRPAPVKTALLPHVKRGSRPTAI